MRTAIISDIHGNYLALKNVLEDARLEHVDKYIFLGDYYMDFPYANEVALELMRMKNAYVIKGNREQIMKNYREENPEEVVNSRTAAIYHVVQDMTQKSYDYFNGLEDELFIRLNPNTLVYATHVSPIYEKQTDKQPKNKCCNNIIYAQEMLEKPFSHEEFLIDYHNFVNSDICTPYIQNIDANVILYGHNHLQSFAYCGDKLIINPGSCGLPFDFNNSASYTILEETRNGFNIIEKRVSYDINALINYTRSSVLYEKNRIICELNFIERQSGRNYTSILDDIIRETASPKNENGNWMTCSDAIWIEAGERFITQYGVN